MADYHIEIERNNVTPAQFLRYVRQQCEKKGIDFGIERDTFKKPLSEGSYSYTVIDREKKCTLRNIEPSLASAVSWQVIKSQGASPATTTPTSWKNIRKQSCAITTGQKMGTMHHVGRKSVRLSPMTTTVSASQ